MIRPRRRYLLLTAISIAAAVVYHTGKIPHSYSVLSPLARIKAAGKAWKAGDLAARFEPLLHPRKGSETPTACYYEPLPPKDGKAAILYRFTWPDERHPIALANWLYLPLRILVYGSTEDIEYVWVEVDLKTERPTQIAFEAPEMGVVFVQHVYQILSTGSFPVQGSHPVLEVASWNHIFNIGSGPATEPAAPLVYLNDSSYRRLRMGRRSLPPEDLLKPRGS